MCSSDIVCVVVMSSVVPSAWCTTTFTGRPGTSSARPHDVDGVVGEDALVVGGVRELQREHTLLLQVGLGDAGERPHDHRDAVHVARLHRRVLARGAFAVVLVTDRDPGDPGLLVLPGEIGQRLHRAVAGVDAQAGRVGSERVVHATEQVPGDVREMAAVLEPRTRRRDVVGGALADGLRQHPHVGEVATVPRGEGLEKLEPVGVGSHHDRDRGGVVGRWAETGFAGIKALLRELVGFGRLEHQLRAVGGGERLVHEVDVESPGERHRGDRLR